MDIKNGMYKVIHMSFKKVFIVFLILVAIVGSFGSYYFYKKYNEIKTNPNIEAKKETDNLVSIVGKLIELPKDEIPTVATISDKEKLVDQAFFKIGENGDKLLAYNTAKVAILYRPSTDKIINVAPIVINQADTLEPKNEHGAIGHVHRIAYYNGTDTAGRAYLAEKSVQEHSSNYQTVAVVNAARKDYKGVLIVDIAGDHDEEVRDLATLLGGVVGALPVGEVAPEADILVISGE